MKVFEIEMQAVTDLFLLARLFEVAKEAGYDTVHDHWGYKAYDTYTIDEAIEYAMTLVRQSIIKQHELPY